MPAEDPAAPDQFKDTNKTASDVITNSPNNQSGGSNRAPESSLEKSFNDAISDDDLIGQLSEELEEMALDLRAGASLAQIKPQTQEPDGVQHAKMLSQEIFQAAQGQTDASVPTPYMTGPAQADEVGAGSSADTIDDSEFGFNEPMAPDGNKLNNLLSKAFVPRPGQKTGEMTGTFTVPQQINPNAYVPPPARPGEETLAPKGRGVVDQSEQMLTAPPALPPADVIPAEAYLRESQSRTLPPAARLGRPASGSPVPVPQIAQQSSAQQSAPQYAAASAPPQAVPAQAQPPLPPAPSPQPPPPLPASARPHSGLPSPPRPQPLNAQPQLSPELNTAPPQQSAQTAPPQQPQIPQQPAQTAPLQQAQIPQQPVQTAPLQQAQIPQPPVQTALPQLQIPQQPAQTLPPQQPQIPPPNPFAPQSLEELEPNFGRTRKDPYGQNDFFTPPPPPPPLPPFPGEPRINRGAGADQASTQPIMPGDQPIALPTYANTKYKAEPAPNTIPPGTQQQAHIGLSIVRGRGGLHEDTALVMPQSAPEPEPDQPVSAQFAKAVPGMQPLSEPPKPMLTPPSNRRIRDQTQPDLTQEKLLPARVERKPPPPRDDETKEKIEYRREPAKAPRTVSKQVSNSDGFRNMRGREGGPPLQVLRDHWRLAVLGLITVVMLISLGSLLISFGNHSFPSMGLSASRKAGKEALKERMFDEAVRYLNEAIRDDPHNPAIYRERGTAYLELQQYPLAVADLTQVINMHGDPGAYLDRAAAYFYMENYDKAVEDYDELIKLHPSEPNPYFGRGLALAKMGRFDEAVENYQKVISLKPNKPEVYEYLGNVQMEQNDFNGAIKSYSSAVRLNSSDANAYFMKGVAESKLGKYIDSERDLSQAIGLQPGRFEFWSDRGFCFSQQQKYREAIENFATALELNPQYTRARQNRTIACEKYVAALKALLQQEPRNAAAYADLAFCYYNMEDFPLSIDAANKAVALDPHNGRGYMARANSELKQKRFDQALADANKAIQAVPDDPQAYLSRARAYLHVHQYSNAVEDYTRCLQEQSNRPLYALRERALAHLLGSDSQYASVDAKDFLKANGWDNALSGSAALICWLSMRQLQDIDGANAILNEGQTHLRRTQWPYPIFKYLKREMTLQQLTATAKNDRELTDVKLWSAFNLLLSGKKAEAMRAFAWVNHSGYQNEDALLAQNR